MKKLMITILLILSIISLSVACDSKSEVATIRISNQTWTEASIIGNITEILLTENTDYNIERIELESTVLQWNAINEGEIDVLPEYTSSLLTVFEDDSTVLYEPDEVYNYVSNKAEEDYGLIMLERIGFYNNYDLAVIPEVAQKYNLETYSDLAEVSDQLTIAADANFKDREDAYPLLQEAYGMDFKEIYPMGVATKFTALENGQAEVVSCYTTDAGIERLGLKLLKDDKNATLRFDAVYIVRAEILERYPDLKDLLNQVKITNEEMTNMNYQVEGEDRSPQEVAEEYLKTKGLINEDY